MKNSLILIVAIVGIIVVVAIVFFALFQPTEHVNPISVATDKSFYQFGNVILVNVHVSQEWYKEGEDVRLQILDANRTSHVFDTFNYRQPNANVTYPLRLAIETTEAGEYWVVAKYRSVEAQTSFQYEGFKTTAVTCQQFSLCTYQLKVGNSIYPINFRMNGTIENMTADLPTKNLKIKLQPPQGQASLQIAVPRAVVDPRAGADGISGADEDFVVFVDETPVDGFEFSTKEGTWAKDLGISENPEKYRILVIPIEEGTVRVDIVGTIAI